MIFDGFPFWIVTIITVAGSGALVLSHFLKMRQKLHVVPTLLFWEQAMAPSRRNILFGKFRSIMTLLLLLTILLLMCFSLLYPVLAPLETKVIIIETSAATDLGRAQQYARSLACQSDRAVIIAAGQTTRVYSNADDSIQTALTAIDRIQTSPSAYTGLTQAVRESRAACPQAEIAVLSGQHLNLQTEIEFIPCPAEAPAIAMSPVSIFFPDQLRLQGQLFCRADDRFDYCSNPQQADFVLGPLSSQTLDGRHRAGFVEVLADGVERRAGLKYRQLVAETADSSQTAPSRSLCWRFHTTLLGVIFVLLLLEIVLVKKHNLI